MNKALEWRGTAFAKVIMSEPRNGFIAVVRPVMAGHSFLEFIDALGIMDRAIGFGVYMRQCDAMQTAITHLNNLPVSKRLGLVNVPEKMITPDEGYYSGGYI